MATPTTVTSSQAASTYRRRRMTKDVTAFMSPMIPGSARPGRPPEGGLSPPPPGGPSGPGLHPSSEPAVVLSVGRPSTERRPTLGPAGSVGSVDSSPVDPWSGRLGRLLPAGSGPGADPAEAAEQRLQGEQFPRVELEVPGQPVDQADGLHRRPASAVVRRGGQAVAVGGGEDGETAPQLVDPLPPLFAPLALLEVLDPG